MKKRFKAFAFACMTVAIMLVGALPLTACKPGHEHEYDKTTNKCAVCGKVNPEYPCIEVENEEVHIGNSRVSFDIYGVKISTCVKGKTEEYDYSEISFYIKKSWDYDESIYEDSNPCYIAYKVYGEAGEEVKSGVITSPEVRIGETVYCIDKLYGLGGGKTYNIVLSDGLVI